VGARNSTPMSGEWPKLERSSELRPDNTELLVGSRAIAQARTMQRRARMCDFSDEPPAARPLTSIPYAATLIRDGGDSYESGGVPHGA